MLARIRQIFSKPKPTLSGEPREFIEKLAPSFIWVLGIGIRGTPAMPALYGPKAWDVIGAHHIELADVGEDDSVFPFNFEYEGRQILPFFSSEERARHFQSLGNISKFQPYRLLAGFVATPENDIFDLLLDAGTQEERRLGQEERLLLRSLSTAG
jgi:hypothetical protein